MPQPVWELAMVQESAPVEVLLVVALLLRESLALVWVPPQERVQPEQALRPRLQLLRRSAVKLRPQRCRRPKHESL